MPQTIDWGRYTTVRDRNKLLMKLAARLRAKKLRVTSTNLAKLLRNITRTGIVTHCWRHCRWLLANARKLRRRHTVPHPIYWSPRRRK
jgi:acyl-CoA reductase-like NAD-dependent aldehyde dehydrogenase